MILPDTLGKAVDAVASKLKSAGIEGARLDARLIVTHAAGWEPQTVLIYPEREIPPDVRQSIMDMAERRANREPLSQILGGREFWSLDFQVTSDTLTPRADTETLVESVLSHIGPAGKDNPLKILDLGTGSGCILLSLLSELPEARGLGVDISEAALSVAQVNAASLGLADRASFHLGRWGEGVEGREGLFDVVASNPPYIPAGDIDALMPEVSRYEPRLALDGGEDGLDAYREIIAGLPGLVKPGGLVCFEVGISQAQHVCELLAEGGLPGAIIVPDLADNERIVMVTSNF